MQCTRGKYRILSIHICEAAASDSYFDTQRIYGVTKPLHLLDIDGAVAELGLVRIFL